MPVGESRPVETGDRHAAGGRCRSRRSLPAKGHSTLRKRPVLPVGSRRRAAYNSEDVIYATPLGEQFDALIQYGLAHRMPID